MAILKSQLSLVPHEWRFNDENVDEIIQRMTEQRLKDQYNYARRETLAQREAKLPHIQADERTPSLPATMNRPRFVMPRRYAKRWGMK